MEDRWLSVHEIAGYLGVSKDSVYTWVTTKGMPGHKVGRFWKFKPGDVDEWIRVGGCNCPYEDLLRSRARDGRGHMKLYYDPITVNSRKVVAGLDLLEVPYEEVKVDYFAQEQKKPEFLAINPNGELPALVDGDMKLWESNAILVYAADKSGPTSAYPQDPKIRADIHRWMLWESSKWFPGCYIYLAENVVKPLLKSEPDIAVLDAHAPIFHSLAAILDARLDGQSWLAGPEVTLADIAVAAPMHLHSYQKLPLQPFPNLRRWMEQVEALPCWQRSDPVPLLGLEAA